MLPAELSIWQGTQNWIRQGCLPVFFLALVEV